MAYTLTYTERFKKRYTKLLVENPYHSSLRTKKVQGADGLFECSANMDIRMIWFYEGDRKIFCWIVSITIFLININFRHTV